MPQTPSFCFYNISNPQTNYVVKGPGISPDGHVVRSGNISKDYSNRGEFEVSTDETQPTPIVKIIVGDYLDAIKWEKTEADYQIKVYPQY